jgi:hypothetical protein
VTDKLLDYVGPLEDLPTNDDLFCGVVKKFQFFMGIVFDIVQNLNLFVNFFHGLPTEIHRFLMTMPSLIILNISIFVFNQILG